MKLPSNVVTIGLIAVVLIAGALAVILAIPRPAAQPPIPSTPGLAASATAPIRVSTKPAATSVVQITGTPMPAALVRVWNSMCVEGVPYTLLSIPIDAKFALVQAQAQVPMTSIPLTGITPLPSVIPTYSTPSFVGGTAGPLPTATFTPQAASGTTIVPVAGGNNGSLGIVPSENSCTELGQVNGVQMVICTGPEGSLFTVYVRQANRADLYQGTLWDCSVAGNTPPPTLVPVGSSTLQPTVVSSTPQPTIVPATPQPTNVPPTPQPTLPPPTAVTTVAPPVTATP